APGAHRQTSIRIFSVPDVLDVVQVPIHAHRPHARLRTRHKGDTWVLGGTAGERPARHTQQAATRLPSALAERSGTRLRLQPRPVQARGTWLVSVQSRSRSTLPLERRRGDLAAGIRGAQPAADQRILDALFAQLSQRV